MSKASDDIAALGTNLTSIGTGVVNLDNTIQSLQAQIANGGSVLTPADQAALDALVTQSATLATTANAVIAAPSTPAPAPVTP